MAQQLTAKQLIEIMGKEIGRLQKLCKDNGIDPTPPQPKGPTAAIKLEPKITVFKSKEEAEEALKKTNKIN